MPSQQAEEPIVSYEALDLSKAYTYWDYIKWQFTERVELIRGRVVKMSPAPGTAHQLLLTKLLVNIHPAFKMHSCEVFVAPFDVRLPIPQGAKDSTVVQPDICVVCDPAKLDVRGCNGAPDLVVEIVSASNAAHDTVTKFQLYEASGVKEYWIVQPDTKHIFVYVLKQGKYIGLPPYTLGQTIQSRYFAQLNVSVDNIF